MADIFSWLVTGFGLLGFWLAGKKLWWSWYVNILNQVLWVIFAVVTGYYAFLVGTAFYFIVFSRNAYLWTKEHFADQRQQLDNLNRMTLDHEKSRSSYDSLQPGDRDS